MARVAVFHNTLDLQGGADAVCLHTCAALAEAHAVTLFTLSASEPAALARRFDVPFDVTVVNPPGGRLLAWGLNRVAPYIGPQLAARTTVLRQYLLGRLDEFDAVVSTANELALPCPSVQYVHFPQFNEHRTDVGTTGRLNRLWTRLAAPAGDDGDRPDRRLLANSAWTADIVAALYGTQPVVCHPPVDPIPGRAWTNREPTVLVLGRIAPDKRVHEAIAVVERLRKRGYDLDCHIVGAAPAAYRAYVDRVRAVAADRPWVALETDAARERVRELLGRYRYGLNMKPDEHFGMAVAEYVAAGMLPFAPADGGQVDVLEGDERLLFETPREACNRIAAAIDGDRRPALERDRFATDRFAAAMRDHLDAVLH